MEAESRQVTVEHWDKDLKGRQKLFVLYFCTDDSCFLNATGAYKKAFGENSTLQSGADANSSRLMKKASIKKSIRLLLKEAQIEIDSKNTYRLLKQFELLAFYNPIDIIKKDGSLIVSDLSELGDYARCITSIKTKVYKDVSITEIELADRLPYMRELAKYFDLIKPDNITDISMPIVMVTPKNNDIDIIIDDDKKMTVNDSNLQNGEL